MHLRFALIYITTSVETDHIFGRVGQQLSALVDCLHPVRPRGALFQPLELLELLSDGEGEFGKADALHVAEHGDHHAADRGLIHATALVVDAAAFLFRQDEQNAGCAHRAASMICVKSLKNYHAYVDAHNECLIPISSRT